MRSSVVMLAAVVAMALFSAAMAIRMPPPSVEVMTQFNQFMVNYNRTYAVNSREYMTRLSNFQRNLKRMEHNRQQFPLAQFGINKYADWSAHEFRRLLNHPIKANIATQSCLASGVSAVHQVTDTPSAFDWRSKNAVNPVKDQGQCGSCWAFSTSASIESALFIKRGGKLLSLSEQEIVDCSTACINEPPYGQVCNQGCNGGWPWAAMTDVMSWKGLASETQYPYTAETDTCVRTASMNLAPLKNYTCLSGNGLKNDSLANEDVMASFSYANGPLSIALDATPLQSYTSGIVTPSSGCSQDQLDHAVVIIGWGVDTASNTKYWIVRNSWAESWGEQGYFRIQRGVNTCGLASAVTYPLVL